MRTAVIYARYSCDKQRDESIEDQLRVCYQWCTKEGYEVVDTYSDRAMSGRTDDRPQFQLMVDRAGESDIVLVYAFDRFSRDPYDAPAYKLKFTKKGTRVVSATEPLPDGPDGILMDKIYEGFAAMESARTARRTKRGMDGNALKLHHNGVRVFGYDHGEDGRFVINEQEAEVVREVFARRINGETINSIARDLKRRGYKTYANNPISYTFVRTMIYNEKYTGVYKWGDFRKEGGMPRIVSDEEFLMAQKVKGKKMRCNEEFDEYVLSGRAFCSCGANMQGVSGRGHANVKYTYYKCNRKCGVKAVRADWLEGRIVDHLRLVLSDESTAMDIAMKVTDAMKETSDTGRLDEAKRSLREAESGIKNIMRAVESGMEFADVRDRLSELKMQKAKAESDIVAYTESATMEPEDFAKFLMSCYDYDAKGLLDAMVRQVVVSESDVTVVLNYDVNDKPARLGFPRGFEDYLSGAPKLSLLEPKAPAYVGYFNGCILLKFSRAA